LTDSATVIKPGVTAGGLSLPHYFGPDQSLFGLLNWPDGPVRAAAIICPPLGYEAVTSYQSLRVLAEDLARAGIATLRVDYASTGNSLGSPRDPDRVAAWRATIEAGRAELRSLGVEVIATVGVRFGASLAADVVAGERPHDLLVMWDPIPSGRRYARALKMFAAGSGDSTIREDGISIAGIEFTEQTLRDISKLNIDMSGLPSACLVVVRPEATDNAAEFTGAEVVVLPGTAEMIDETAEEAKVAQPIVDHIVNWVRRQDLGQPLPPQSPPNLAAETVEVAGDSVLRHHLVRVGPWQLFGVLTTSDSTSPASAVLMLNNGAAPNIGPGRAWVEWSLREAAQGLTTLRLDMSGLGESRARDAREAHVVYSRAVNQDVQDAVTFLRDAGAPKVAVLGLCSGATHGFRALGAGTEVDAIVSINPGLHSPVCYYRTDLRHGYHRALPRLFAQPLYKTPLFGLLDRVPTFVWRVLDKTRLIRTPVLLPKIAVDAHVPSLLVFGDDEWGLKALRQRDPKATRAIFDDKTLTVEVFDALDHSMFDLDARRRVEDSVHDWLFKQLIA